MAQEFTSTALTPPSLSTSPTPRATPPPPWFVPGPSSRFNIKHERSRSQYHFQRSYTPTAPQLSTAHRAHRRVQSTANVPTVKRLFSSPPPATSDARIPAQQTPMSRFYSYTPNRVPHNMNALSPVTPSAKRTGSDSRPNSKLQDSPFSDYFTDDGRSTNNGNGSYRAPSAETQQLLVRLNKLQAQLMRSSPDDVLSEHEKAAIVARKVGEIETQFHALSIETQSQTRLPPDMEDSGLFMDEEGENEETPDAQVDSFERAAKEFLATDISAEDAKAKHEVLLKDAQAVLQNVNKANEQLRQLNRELRANHDKCGSIIDSLELENAELRSKTTTLEFDNDASEASSDNLKTENAGLKVDLDFNRAELLFLKLSHRALEVEIEALHNGAHRLGSYAPELREEIHHIQRTKIKERMSAWEDHWVEIEQKMRQRRLRHEDSDGEESVQRLLGLGIEDDDQSSAVAEEIIEIAQVKPKQPSLAGEDSAVGIEDTPSPPTESVQGDIMVPLQINKETQTEPQVDEAAESELEAPKPAYTDQLTQTTPLPSPATSSWILASEVDYEEEIQSYTNDCAITTSSEDNGDDSEDEVSTEVDVQEETEVKTPTSPIRVAWQDLWDGLTNLAGMGEGY